ncbi:MAG: YihA family ribosome biogenesis GTP-binding protein [Acidimicrobiales bacterium]|nr:YihA family ribosome biogenesis GTP-binding protein [Acidimicrobiales bacterium]
MSAPLDLTFVLSADSVDRLPASPAEVAVVGRSNVGKSSLLNALGRRKNLAHTSKTPGRTRLLNCFAVGEPGGATVVDCPGYGYASVSKTTRAAWQGMIEDYLRERDALAMVMVLVDGEIGPTGLDLQMLGWLRDNALPHTVVATKHDKVKSSRREKRKRELAAACGLERTDVVWTSASKNVGIDRLRDLTRLWLGVT